MKPYWKITLAYLAFGIIWIVASDAIAKTVATSISRLSLDQTVKGVAYIIMSGLFIFFLMRRTFRNQVAEEEERVAVFHKTVEGAHHILLNYLNQMQLVTLEAEKCASFDKDILELAKELSAHAANELKALHTIETVTASKVESAVYRHLRGPSV
jgi:hypothetical protein